MKLQCIMCGKECEGNEIVTHINMAHKGMLQRYMLFFPFSRVVSPDLYMAIKDAMESGQEDDTIPELKNISQADRELIIQTAEIQKPQRSEITVEEDYE